MPIAFLSPFSCYSIAIVISIATGWYGVAALVFRMFAKWQALGRRFAYRSLACAVVASPIFLYAAPGTNIPGQVYATGAVPLVLSVLAVALYLRPRAERRGFEVISPHDSGPETRGRCG